MKEDQMGRACSAQERRGMYAEMVGKHEEKRVLLRPRRRWYLR
jgi:hypothetical protein